MKILILAASPPPWHGQSFMTQLLIDHFPDHAPSSQLRHIDATVSESLDQLGQISLPKCWRLFTIFLRALWTICLFQPHLLYYVPATGVRSQVWRDWLLFGCLRPFVSRTILHWHGSGLHELYEHKLHTLEKKLTRLALGRVTASIILSTSQRDQVAWLHPQSIAIVPNGIPDPCPDFLETILPQRLARLTARTASSAVSSHRPFRCLFLAHASREKGLFDAIDAIALANAELRRQHASVHFTLTVAGSFLNPSEQQEFEHRIRQADLQLPFIPAPRTGAPSPSHPADHLPAVTYAGFVSGPEKDQLLRQSDCLLFPSYFPTEVQPVAVIEALAYGLPVLVSTWRNLPELVEQIPLPTVAFRSPHALKTSLIPLLHYSDFTAIRSAYTRTYSMNRHLSLLQSVLCDQENSNP
jgi:glycosyltransferase involved in cell wall biosynthesis